MSLVVCSGMKRFDVAKLLESKIDTSAWKGDEHTKGVFFMDTHGYVCNKVMAIRIRYETNKTPEVFYSFGGDEESDDKIRDKYPFADMKVRPKKHFLLFDREEIAKPDLGKLFDCAPVGGRVRIVARQVQKILSKVKNKRERGRSVARLFLSEHLQVQVLRSQIKQKRNVLSEGSVECKVLDPPKGDAVCLVNANTLASVLEIFSSPTKVVLSFGRDRIMITGNDHQGPNVEVVISQIKKA